MSTTAPMRIGDVCELLSVTRDTIYDYVRKGYLRAKRTPSGQLLFDREQVEAIRQGEKPSRIRSTDPSLATPKLDERPRAPTWKELAPWQVEVEAERAALDIDDREFEHDERDWIRDQKRQLRAQDERRRGQEEADYQRIAKLKQLVLAIVWIPLEHRAAVVAEVERFATPTQIPAWLPAWQQQHLVTSKANAVIAELLEQARRRKETERQAAVDRQAKERQAATERQAKQLEEAYNRIKGSTESSKPTVPADITPKTADRSSPRTVADALRRRGVSTA